MLALPADGHHRAPWIPDLLIAESAGVVVLHEDKDFGLIAEVARHPTERLSG